MRVDDRLFAMTPAEVGVDHPALDRSGADERDLDHEIVEFTRLHPREHHHLRAALELKDADRVGLSEHRIGLRIVLRDRGEAERFSLMLLDEIEGEVDLMEHPEAEEIDLEEPERLDIVLIPLDDRPPLKAGWFDGDDLIDWLCPKEEATRMDREMAREADELDERAPHRPHARLVWAKARFDKL